MSTEPRQFTAFSRLLHWTMAAMVLTHACASALPWSLSLVELPRARVDPSPAGYRDSDPGRRSLREPAANPPPPFPATMSRAERLAATASELTMYGLMFVLPAGRLGNAVGGALPDCPLWILASAVYSSARCNAVCGAAEDAHDPRVPVLPDVFAHFAAVLFHTLIVRDGILNRMVPWNIPPPETVPPLETDAETGRDLHLLRD